MSFERAGRFRGGPGSRLGSLGTAGLILAALFLAGVWAAVHLRLDARDLWPGGAGWELAGEFFAKAIRPAWRFEGEWQGGGALALPRQACAAAVTTVVFAASALSVALVAGLGLGFLGSSRLMGRRGAVLMVAARLLANGLRAVHELVWAVLLLAALGHDPLVAVIAIALPYAGTLAKIFAEMLDESPPEAAAALTWAGATPAQAFVAGMLPRALPDMTAYVFYRFECALRSSAVLGFFGFPTLGYYLAASFENLHYGEVWTYLYVLLALVLTVDWWSGRLRRELVT